jgi:hypothetical protein
MKIADIPGGLRLDIEETSQPTLRLETTRHRRMRLSADGEPLFWARIQPGYAGVWIVRAKEKQLMTARPIRADEARDGRSMEAWTRWFAKELQSGTSPLYKGEWRMSSMRQAEPSMRDSLRSRVLDIYFSNAEEGAPGPAYGALEAMSTPRVHFENWMGGGADVLPLRDPSPEDSGRIKSWRKHARDGTLPPILLWWISGLDSHVVLDGHDRLCAAAAEGVAPRLITLWQGTDVPIEHTPDAIRAEFLKSYERAFAAENLSPGSRQALNERLVWSYKETWLRSTTSAKASPTLEVEWLPEMLAAAEGEDLSEVLKLEV